MKRTLLILTILISQFAHGQGNFFWSYNNPDKKYGLIYNWWVTQETTTVKYGYLYNWYAATDPRGITSSSDWKVPTDAEVVALRTYIASQFNNYDGTNTLGTNSNNKQGMAVATLYYDDWYASGTIGSAGDRILNAKRNITGFNARPSGFRDANYGGMFSDFVMHTSVAAGEEVIIMALGHNYTTLMVTVAYPKYVGLSVRLLYTGTGTPTTYTGNDGKVYKCVQIGTQIWLSENLCETKYRNGDWIKGFDNGVYTLISSAEWTGLITGAMCSYYDDESNALDVNKIAPAGWHVPTNTEWNALRDYIGSNNAGVLKMIGNSHWISPNVGATNSTGFSARGAGRRLYHTGEFAGEKYFTEMWASTQYDATGAYIATLWAENTLFQTHGQSDKTYGRSIRLIKDDSTWYEGMTIADQDGHVYQTVKIGTQVWITQNWRCTRWANGNPILNVTDNTQWVNTQTAAWCYYKNNIGYN